MDDCCLPALGVKILLSAVPDPRAGSTVTSAAGAWHRGAWNRRDMDARMFSGDTANGYNLLQNHTTATRRIEIHRVSAARPLSLILAAVCAALLVLAPGSARAGDLRLNGLKQPVTFDAIARSDNGRVSECG